MKKKKNIDMDEMYRKAIEKLNNAPNDQAFRIRTERALKNMKHELDEGLISYEEYYDLEFFYYENWIEPITFNTKLEGEGSEVILN